MKGSKKKRQPTPNAHKKRPNPPTDTAPINKDGNKDHNPKPETQCCSEINDNRKQIVVNFPKKKNWDATTWIAAIATAINLGILIGTASIWNTSNKTFEEVKNEFKTANEPFLQISAHLDKMPPVTMQAMVIDFTVKNLGKYPIKIISGKMLNAIKPNTPDFSETAKFSQPGINQYITNDYPLTFSDSQYYRHSLGDFKSMESDSFHLFYWGYFKYQNLITDSIGEYQYMLQIHPFANTYNLLINDKVESNEPRFIYN